MTDGQDTFFVGGLGAQPVGIIAADAGAVIFPASRIGRATGIGEAQGQVEARRAIDTEIEPLVIVRAIIRPDRQIPLPARAAKHFDIAAVEIGCERD